jgi:O-acetyl-ADP-ribose deacetylase (regulator of RNase III)
MEFVTGNLFEAGTQALVNTVNTVGVMGKGIALQFRNMFPENYKLYVAACKRNELQPGKLLIVTEHQLKGDRIIVNFPTKTEWRLKSKYEYIEEGLKELEKAIQQYQIKSIAIPPLGCGNGGLKWEKVKPMIEHYLGHLDDVEIQVYEPDDSVKEMIKKQDEQGSIKLTKARSMLLYAMFHYESLGENCSLFVANKLAYFFQRLGDKEFGKLKFQGHFYGPYSVGVGHLLYNLNGKYVKGMEQMDAKAFEPLELQYSRLDEVTEYIRKELSDEQKSRLLNLLSLIDGFQSALSLEILATVDFIKKENPGIDRTGIIRTIASWSDRKQRLFKDQYIEIAADRLDHYSERLSDNFASL